MEKTTNPSKHTKDQPTHPLRPCADNLPLDAAAGLQTKLDSNLDRLKADAAYVLEHEADDEARALIELGLGPEQQDEKMWWRIGYYLGLMRAIEILEDYED